MIPNRPTLDKLTAMAPELLAAMPPDELALLSEEVEQAVVRARRLKEKLEGALDLRYRQRATAIRQAEGKDTGTVRFEDGGFVVIADLPKRVKWDQVRLATIVDEIRAAGDDPSEYVSVEFKVAERAYGVWPESIRSAFTPARTVETGKPVYRIEPKKETL